MSLSPDRSHGTIWVAAVLTCRTDAPASSRAWLEERAGRLRAIPDVERVDVVTTGSPPHAGVVLHFGTAEAYERYCHEHLADLERSIESSSWSAGRPVQRVLERTGPRSRDRPRPAG